MIDIKDMKFGVLSSPPDDRDYIVSAILPQETQYPEKLRLPYIADSMYHQGTTSKCVCYSAKYIVEYFNIKEFNKRIPISVDFLYSNRKPDQDSYRLLPFEGTYPRDIFYNLYKEGVCEDKYAPMKTNPDTYNDYIEITEEMRTNAQKYNLLSYARVYTDNDIKQSLINGLPVSISYPVTNKFHQLNNGYMDVVTDTDKPFGNHMMTIIGWHNKDGKEYYDVLNSYGKESGINGIMYIPIENYFNEAWVLVDKKWIDPTPIPTKPKYFRVQCGAYKSKENAQKLQLDIKTKGFATYLIHINGLWKVQCGCFSIHTNADKLSADLKAKGFSNFITYY